MTGLQDDICDALVGAPLTRLWVGGPLHVAALVVDPGLGPVGTGASRGGQLARTLGWPSLFCEAIFGANAALEHEADRRSLAITLFANVPLPCPGRLRRAAPGLGVACGTWAALRAHPLACFETCPLLLATRDLADPPAPVGARARVWAWAASVFDLRRRDCPAASLSRAGRDAHLALVGLRRVLRNHNSTGELKAVLRLSAKVEADRRGVDGAVSHCLELARRLKLKT